MNKGQYGYGGLFYHPKPRQLRGGQLLDTSKAKQGDFGTENYRASSDFNDYLQSYIRDIPKPVLRSGSKADRDKYRNDMVKYNKYVSDKQKEFMGIYKDEIVGNVEQRLLDAGYTKDKYGRWSKPASLEDVPWLNDVAGALGARNFLNNAISVGENFYNKPNLENALAMGETAVNAWNTGKNLAETAINPKKLAMEVGQRALGMGLNKKNHDKINNHYSGYKKRKHNFFFERKMKGGLIYELEDNKPFFKYDENFDDNDVKKNYSEQVKDIIPELFNYDKSNPDDETLSLLVDFDELFEKLISKKYITNDDLEKFTDNPIEFLEKLEFENERNQKIVNEAIQLLKYNKKEVETESKKENKEVVKLETETRAKAIEERKKNIENLINKIPDDTDNDIKKALIKRIKASGKLRITDEGQLNYVIETLKNKKRELLEEKEQKEKEEKEQKEKDELEQSLSVIDKIVDIKEKKISEKVNYGTDFEDKFINDYNNKYFKKNNSLILNSKVSLKKEDPNIEGYYIKTDDGKYKEIIEGKSEYFIVDGFRIKTNSKKIPQKITRYEELKFYPKNSILIDNDIYTRVKIDEMDKQTYDISDSELKDGYLMEKTGGFIIQTGKLEGNAYIGIYWSRDSSGAYYPSSLYHKDTGKEIYIKKENNYLPLNANEFFFNVAYTDPNYNEPVKNQYNANDYINAKYCDIKNEGNNKYTVKIKDNYKLSKLYPDRKDTKKYPDTDEGDNKYDKDVKKFKALYGHFTDGSNEENNRYWILPRKRISKNKKWQ